MRSVIALSGFLMDRLVPRRRTRRRVFGAMGSVLAAAVRIDATAAGRLGWAGLLLLLGSTLLIGLNAGGYTGSFLNQAGTKAGLAIAKVEIAGHVQLDEIAVLEALDIRSGMSLASFDAAAALERLKQNGWIETASVRKIYPGTLKVTLTERKPLALWQRGALISLVDRDGTIISDDVSDRFAALPLFVGHGARTEAAGFLVLLDRYPSIRSRLRAAVFVSGRRWDLVLDNKIEVRLPEYGMEAALDELLRLNAESGLMNRDVVAVDLRLRDEIVVRLSDDAVVRRKAAASGDKDQSGGETDT